MIRIILTLLAISILYCCSSEYANTELIRDVENNNTDRLIKNFYQRYKLEKAEFKQVVALYSDFLKEKKLNRIEYIDEFNFKRRDRNGYIYLDDNNNFIASITFKYVMLPDSSSEINYIDFRNSTKELPCIKFPSKFPIKCVALPNPKVPNIDSLLKIYPVNVGKHEIYHSHLVTKKRFEERGDSLHNVISFNTGNKLIGENFENILNDIENSLGANIYTFSEVKKIGEPTINLSYDPSVHNKNEILDLVNIIYKYTNTKVILKQEKTFRTSWGYAEPVISVGYAYSEARVKF